MDSLRFIFPRTFSFDEAARYAACCFLVRKARDAQISGSRRSADPMCRSPSPVFSCSEWEKLPPTMRAVYMAGAFDSLTGFAADEIGRRVSEHYTVCVGRSRLDN